MAVSLIETKPSVFDKLSFNSFMFIEDDKSRYIVSSFPGTFFSTILIICGSSSYMGSKKNAPPMAPIKNATTSTKTISRLGI